MDDGDELSFLKRRLSPNFAVKHVIIEAGSELGYDDSKWDDAFVIVRRGTIELEEGDGTRRSFTRGDMLCLGWLSLRLLRNPGPDPVLLVSFSRRN